MANPTWIWTSPGGTYRYGRHANGVEAWFVSCIGGNGWQQLYGTYPPADVLMAWVNDLRRGRVA